MNQITLTLTPRRPAILEGADTEVEVLAQLAAPDAPESIAARAPLNLALVIDRSGSMAGRPLREAKRCAEYIVQMLGPQDRISVVKFDDEVCVVVTSTDRRQKDHIMRALRAIEAGGSTALHDGWLQGAEQAALHVSHGAIARVLLLTDGQANAGETDPRLIASDCGRLAASGVSTSTYGLGESFNEELLGAMAEVGGGHAYYGETGEDLMDPFREEFEGDEGGMAPGTVSQREVAT